MWKVVLFIYWGTCFALTHLPVPDVPTPSVPHLDKVIHFAMYLGLSILFNRNFPKFGVKAFFILTAYAIVDELSQPYFHRDAEWLDGLADVTGIILGMLIVRKLSSRFFQRA